LEFVTVHPYRKAVRGRQPALPPAALCATTRRRPAASFGRARPELPMLLDFFTATILGIVEGLTEFIPVSSTGHLLLVQHFFGFGDETFGKSFAVLIQLGAILALVTIYFVRLWKIALALPSDPDARRFTIGVLIAFLPAAVIGALAYRIIKDVLFNVWIVCVSLIVGGFILMVVDRMALNVRYKDATKFSLPMYLAIGFAQCLAMIPGVSRSGATIVSAMLLGADRRSATEFSFFLAIPTMIGAFAYDLYKNYAQMSGGSALVVAVGFITSFIAGWFVVKTLLDYVSSHGFSLFVWWRIIVGALGLIALGMLG
jgi:undecaprenyl-diphosphatase